jgi:hypothetical protein
MKALPSARREAVRLSARFAACLAVPLALWAGDALAQHWNEDEARRQIVQDSIARWNGECPCPYSYAWNGKQCADASAYMKRVPGSPYCYPQDVPPYEIYQWRKIRGL